MSWKVTQDPEYQPVTLANAKMYLRVQDTAEDAIIERLIRTAADYCEEELDIALMDQQITLKLDKFPAGKSIYLPRANLLEVTSVSYIDDSGNQQAYTDFVADTFGNPARIVTTDDAWPTTSTDANSVTIVYRAGFKADESGSAAPNPIPAAIEQAMYLLITHWYDNRTAIQYGSMISQEIALAVTACLTKYKQMGV
jgi:uncharacterized phiE125 gp8 family phage protein